MTPRGEGIGGMLVPEARCRIGDIYGLGDGGPA